MTDAFCNHDKQRCSAFFQRKNRAICNSGDFFPTSVSCSSLIGLPEYDK